MRRLGWILLAAAVARLLLQLWWQPELTADAADYDRLARGLVAGEGLLNTRGEPTSFRPPLYPLYVAFWYGAFSPGTRLVTIVQVLFDLVTIGAAFSIARHWLPERWALLAAGLVGANFALISASGRVLSESLFTMLLTSGVGLAILWAHAAQGASGSEGPDETGNREGSLSDVTARPRVIGATAGLVFGLASLARGVILPYAPFLVLTYAIIRRRVLPGSTALLGVFFLTLAPWTVRNSIVHQAFVPVTTQVGITLYAGVAPPGGIFGLQPNDSIVRRTDGLTEPEQSRILAREAIRQAAADPLRTARLEARKIIYFWSPVDWELLPRYGTFNPTFAWTALAAAAFLLLGAGGRGPRRRTLWPVWAPVLFLFGMALVFHGSPRYRLPAEPMLAILAAAGAAALYGRLGSRRGLHVLGSLGLLSVLGMLLSDPLRSWVGTWIR